MSGPNIKKQFDGTINISSDNLFTINDTPIVAYFDNLPDVTDGQENVLYIIDEENDKYSFWYFDSEENEYKQLLDTNIGNFLLSENYRWNLKDQETITDAIDVLNDLAGTKKRIVGDAEEDQEILHIKEDFEYNVFEFINDGGEVINDGELNLIPESFVQSDILTKNSILKDNYDNYKLKLDGDEEDPGNYKLYGTDNEGNKGWHDIPEEFGQDDIETKDSITKDSEDDKLKFVNDEEDPGNYKLYGTDNEGNKGWHDIPADFELKGTNYLFVRADGTPEENGDELLAAYETAKTMDPAEPDPIEETDGNYVHIVIAPGYYELPDTLDIDTPAINFLSLTGQRDVMINGSILINTQYIEINGIELTKESSWGIFFNHSGANNIKIKNFKSNTESLGTGSFPNIDSNIIFENCDFTDETAWDSAHNRNFGGTFINCKFGNNCIHGDTNREIKAIFIDCEFGNNCIGGNDIRITINSIFKNCVFGDHCIGTPNSQDVIIKGSFENCKFGENCVGYPSGSIIDAEFINCVGGENSFGNAGTPNSAVNIGTYISCRILEGDFGELKAVIDENEEVEVVNGGTGYTNGDIVTVDGGTGTSAQLIVGVSGGVIVGAYVHWIGNIPQEGLYTEKPANPVSVTGGSGTGATFNINNWKEGTAILCINGNNNILNKIVPTE